jgi:hypothetical protein
MTPLPDVRRESGGLVGAKRSSAGYFMRKR